MNKTLPDHNRLSDGRGRSISYLRLSVTDRCNLACFYCRTKDTKFIPHDDILRYEEMLTLAALARKIQINKIRLTGGEPFARRDFMDFLGMLQKVAPGMDLRITTNGTLLPGKSRELTRLGLTRLNISLDSLKPSVFSQVTGQDLLPKVLKGVEESLEAGISVKINAVALKGLNDTELPAFIDLARELDIEVRFIEFMPIGANTRWDSEYFWSSKDILARAREIVELTPVRPARETAGPAQVFEIAGGRGRLGVISPLSNHFCDSCNRIRITPDGLLRPCLFSDKEYKLRPLLRHQQLGPEACLKVIQKALANKPLGYHILETRQQAAVCGRGMSAIGG